MKQTDIDEHCERFACLPVRMNPTRNYYAAVVEDAIEFLIEEGVSQDPREDYGYKNDLDYINLAVNHIEYYK